MPARFQACVRVLVPYSDGELRPMWDFVNRNRRLIKTLKAAEEECEKHKRLWTKATRGHGHPGLEGTVRRQAALGLASVGEEEIGPPAVCHLDDNRPS